MTYTDEELLARVEYASDLIDTLVTLAADMERHAVDEWDESDFIIQVADTLRALITYRERLEKAESALHDEVKRLRALPVAEPAPVAVRVKPLVAGRHPRGFIATDHGGGGAYIFALNGGRYECIKGLAHSPRFDTSKEALAAAQADHAARVLSQIDAVPAAQVRAAALEEAAKLPPYDCDGDPAGSFDHHVFVKRDAIRALIEKEQT